MKRISILMLVVMITSLIPMCVSANTEIYTDERGYTYELDYAQMIATVIDFPAGESTYTVPAVACEKIVERSDGSKTTFRFHVIRINPSNSSNLDNAEHITLPYTLRLISQLHNLPKLKSVDFSQCTDLTALYHYTFENCTALESIDLSMCTSLPTIEEYTFAGCTSLESVKLPDSIKTIADSAFEGCERLTEISIPEGVTSIGANAFKNCKSLKSITLPAGVNEIKSGTFSGCANLEEIVIMCNTYADVKTIAGDAGSNAKIIYKLVKPTEVKLGADGIVTWYHPDVPKEFHLQLNKAVDGIWGEELTPIGDEVIILGNTIGWKYDFSQQIRERGEDRYCVTISAIPISAAFEESDRAWSNIQTYEKPNFDVYNVIDETEFAVERYKDHFTATYLNITDSTLYYTIAPTGQYSLDNPPEIDTSGDGVPLKGLGYMAWDQMTLDGFTSDEAADVFMVAVNDIGMKSDIRHLYASAYTAPHFTAHAVTDTTYSFDITASHRVQGMIIVGKYEGNTLKGLSIHKMTAPFFSYSVADSPIEAEGSTYKIFFWDGADTMTQICNGVGGNVQF